MPQAEDDDRRRAEDRVLRRVYEGLQEDRIGEDRRVVREPHDVERLAEKTPVREAHGDHVEHGPEAHAQEEHERYAQEGVRRCGASGRECHAVSLLPEIVDELLLLRGGGLEDRGGIRLLEVHLVHRVVEDRALSRLVHVGGGMGVRKPLQEHADHRVILVLVREARGGGKLADLLQPLVLDLG